METEVSTELRRAVAGKEASAAVAAEQSAQVANPRNPSSEVAAGIGSVVETIDSLGGRRKASVQAAQEQVSRVAQHLMSTEVGLELRRKVAASVADALMEEEKARRSSQHHMQTEVSTELRRAVAGKEASAAAAAEQAAQVTDPRHPSADVAAGIANIVESVDAIGSASAAKDAAEQEQMSRVAQHIMSTEIGLELRRRVAAALADAMMNEEQSRRISRHHFETEVSVELRRSVAGKDVTSAAVQEQAEQISNPPTPNEDVRASKVSVNAAIVSP